MRADWQSGCTEAKTTTSAGDIDDDLLFVDAEGRDSILRPADESSTDVAAFQVVNACR